MIEIDNILDAEKYISDLDAVIFDLDDTLYSEKQYVKSGYRKIAESFKIPELADEMWSVFESGGKAIDEVLERHSLTAAKDEALHIYRFQTPDIKLYPGVRQMLSRMKNVGIITDGRPEGQKAKLRALELDYPTIITDELGGMEYRKPNPRAFELMVKQLGVQYEKACYIGDNIKKDFIAPEKLCMRCIWFKNSDGLYSDIR